MVLDILAKRYCPLPETYEIHYNLSIMQIEYALDIYFKKQEVLQPLLQANTHKAQKLLKYSTFGQNKNHLSDKQSLSIDGV